MSEITITDLFDLKTLQQVQDIFSELTSLAAIITDSNGIPVTKGSGFTDFCMKYTRCSELGLKRCMECDKKGAMETLANGKPYIYRCHVGLYDFAAPIMIGNNVIGCIIGGQAVCGELNEEKLKNAAQELGIDEQIYVEAAGKIKIRDMENVKSAAECLFKLANAISSISYSNYLSLKKIEETEHNLQNLSSRAAKNLVKDIKGSLDGWIDVVKNLFNEYDGSNFDEIKYSVLSESEKVYSMIENSADSKKSELGLNIIYSERPYSVKNLIGRLSNEAIEVCRESGLEFSCHIDENISETLFGNDENIGFIIDFVLADFITNSRGGNIRLQLLSDKTGYSENIRIVVSAENIVITSERIDEIMSCFTDYNHSYENKSYDKADYTFIGFLLRNMSGKIEINSDAKTGTVFLITIPQLNVKG